jgi:hypothetical protein
MPEFVDVASHFDDASVYDAYGAAFSFMGQFASFEESDPDGNIAKKRTLSVRPGTVLPARRCITFAGETWIVGGGNVDIFQDIQVRQAFWIKKSSGLATRRTPLEALTGLPGVELHVSRTYLKDTVNGVSSTQYDPFWDLNHSTSEATQRGHFFSMGSAVYRVRGVHDEQSGFRLAQCDQLDNGLLSLTYGGTEVYDPVTDTYTGAPTVLPCLAIEPSQLYNLVTQNAARYHSGDLSLLTTVAIPAGQNLSLQGRSWLVLDTQPELDAFLHHIRPV